MVDRSVLRGDAGSDDRVVLLSIRNHPWATVQFLARMLCRPERTVYRLVNRLEAAGYLQCMKLHAPDVRGCLYALNAQGIAFLAHQEGVSPAEYAWMWGCDPGSLGRAIVRVRKLVWARNLLTSLLGHGLCQIRWAVSPPPPEPWGTLVDAVAAVSVGSKEFRLLVVADIGGIPVLRLLRRLPRPSEGEILVIVSAGRWFWSLVGDGGGKVVRADVLSGEIVGWERAVGQPGLPFPAEFPRRRYRQDLLLGSILVDNRFGGVRTLDLLRQLSPDEWTLLGSVVAWPYSIDQVAVLLGWSLKRASAVAFRLRKKGVVLEVEKEKRKFLVPTPAGLGVLGSQWGLTPRQYARAMGWGEDGHVSWRAWKHYSLIAQIGVGLKRMEARLRGRGRLLFWDHEAAVPSYRYLVPDAMGMYLIGDRVCRFWVEVERGSAGRAIRRLRRHVRTSWLFDRLLVVCEVPSRAREVLLSMSHLDWARGRVAVASVVDLMRDGQIDPLRPVWWLVGGGPGFCFPDLERELS